MGVSVTDKSHTAMHDTSTIYCHTFLAYKHALLEEQQWHRSESEQGALEQGFSYIPNPADIDNGKVLVVTALRCRRRLAG